MMPPPKPPAPPVKPETVTITYRNGPKLQVPRGTTVLAASHAAGVPHAAVCGGRGRCSTCRVRVLESGAPLPPADQAERAALQGLEEAGEVRLACRLRVQSDITVERLLPPGTKASSPDTVGRLTSLSVMFIDLRDFSRLAGRMHPFDVVFLLNRFFEGVDEAVSQAGGTVDKLMGDGAMALFGIGASPRQGARQAVCAARALSRFLISLNQELAAEWGEPLRMGIGIHCGEAIVGRIGSQRSARVTAIGDIVNVASRLEGLTKRWQAQLVLSEAVAIHVEEACADLPRVQTELPNYDGSLSLRIAGDASQFPPIAPD